MSGFVQKSYQKVNPQRKAEIVRRVCEGKPNKIIAHELCLSEGTIKEYIYSIFRETGAKNRTELAVMELRKKGEPNAEITRGIVFNCRIRNGAESASLGNA